MWERRLLVAILIAYVLLAGIYSVVTPPFEASDELWHYPMVKYIADHWDLPVQDPEHVGPWRQEGSQPPLYYALGALLTCWIDTSDMDAVRRLNFHADNGLITEDGNVNLVVHRVEAERFPWRGTVLAVHLVRGLSVLLGVVTVYCTYRVARALWPDRGEIALGAAALVAFNPMVLFIHGSVNNDTLAMAICALTVWWLIDGLRHRPEERTWRWEVVLGGMLGAAALTKASALALLPLAALAITWWAWTHRCWRAFWRGGAITAGMVVLIAGWWYLRNWRLYGDPMGLEMFIAILGQRAVPATWRQLWGERQSFLMAYWGLFGGVNVPMPRWVYGVLDGVTVVALVGALAGVGRWVVQRVRSREGWRRWADLRWAPGALLWGLAGLVVISWSRWATTTWSSQGRLVFPAMVAWATGMAWGLTWWLPRRWGRTVLALLGGGLFLLASWVPWGVIRPTYQPAPPPSEADLARVEYPLEVEFGGQMRLLGYDLEADHVRPGEALRLTLYWEAMGPIDRDWSIFFHVLDRDTELVLATRDRYPGEGLLAASELTPGQRWADRYVVWLPETTYAPTDAVLEVGLYDLRTGERPPVRVVQGGDQVVGVEGNALRFQPIGIEPLPGDVPNPVEVNFGDRMALVGWDVDRRVVRRGEELKVVLYWECLAPMRRNYSVSVQLVGANDVKAGQRDAWPLDGAAPTSAWSPGQRLEDPYVLEVFSDAVPEVYELIVRVYDAETMELLRLIEDGRVLPDDRVSLGKVRVVE